jgi:hypothetical protein
MSNGHALVISLAIIATAAGYMLAGHSAPADPPMTLVEVALAALPAVSVGAAIAIAIGSVK